MTVCDKEFLIKQKILTNFPANVAVHLRFGIDEDLYIFGAKANTILSCTEQLPLAKKVAALTQNEKAEEERVGGRHRFSCEKSGKSQMSEITRLLKCLERETGS